MYLQKIMKDYQKIMQYASDVSNGDEMLAEDLFQDAMEGIVYINQDPICDQYTLLGNFGFAKRVIDYNLLKYNNRRKCEIIFSDYQIDKLPNTINEYMTLNYEK